MENDRVHAVELNDVLKDLDLDLSRADGRAGLGALLREIQEHLNASCGPAAAEQCGDTTVYNAAPTAGLDDVGVACGV